RAELHEARKNIPPKNPVDADKLLAASRGEFVEGISDPNDSKWIPGHHISSNEVKKTENEVRQTEDKQHQNSEPEEGTPCNQTGEDNCPDCGAVMGDATYQETF
ncbi:TPA: exodeoxyribonuclease VIII, partial [Shigella flexneri]|nr:exodeoxyribonuclease VIII [Shigella flexneri]